MLVFQYVYADLKAAMSPACLVGNPENGEWEPYFTRPVFCFFNKVARSGATLDCVQNVINKTKLCEFAVIISWIDNRICYLKLWTFLQYYLKVVDKKTL